MTLDWHSTQNYDYLELSIKRLKESKLKWLNQIFSLVEDISKKYISNPDTITINDFGCNVGHFYRACKDSSLVFHILATIFQLHIWILRRNHFPIERQFLR